MITEENLSRIGNIFMYIISSTTFDELLFTDIIQNLIEIIVLYNKIFSYYFNTSK